MRFDNTGRASLSIIGHDFMKLSGSNLEVKKMFFTRNLPILVHVQGKKCPHGGR